MKSIAILGCTGSIGQSALAVVDAHADRVVAAAGRIDVSFNAVSVRAVQGVALTEMYVEDFLEPVDGLCRTNFLTATAAARRPH